MGLEKGLLEEQFLGLENLTYYTTGFPPTQYQVFSHLIGESWAKTIKYLEGKICLLRSTLPQLHNISPQSHYIYNRLPPSSVPIEIHHIPFRDLAAIYNNILHFNKSKQNLTTSQRFVAGSCDESTIALEAG